MDVPTTVSVIVGVISVIISVFALWQASLSARESRDNFDKTKGVLAEIDKRAAVTESIVAENQRELLDTVKKLVIPDKSDADEQLKREIVRGLMQLFLNAQAQDAPSGLRAKLTNRIRAMIGRGPPPAPPPD